MTSVLFVHGWQNERPPDHWQTITAGQLRERGIEVRHPQLPDPFTPSPEFWVEAIAGELESMPPGDRAVVCHSLGCLAWGHLAPRLRPDQRPERVCWVAPAGPAFLAEEPAIQPFGLDPNWAEAIRASSSTEPFRLVWSDADPYCAEGADVAYGEPLGLDSEFISGHAHINAEAGFGDWPRMLAWCEDPGVRFA